MIVTAIFGLAQTLINFVISLLPNISLNLPALNQTAFGQWVPTLASWGGLLPISEAVGLVLLFVNVVLPAWLTYKIANWTWRHIPDLGGFGPGAG